MVYLKDALFILQALVSLALIGIVASQTTKSEGLSGTIGGQVTSSFKGKPGMEEQVRRWTIYTSVAWGVVCVITAIISSRV